MTIIEHFEKFLGPVQQGWRETNAQENDPRLMVVRFSNTPFEAASTYATIGLSDHLLELADGRQVRQELLFAAHDNYASDEIASFLLSFSEFVRSKSWALARGDVVGPSAALIPGVAVNSVLRMFSGYFSGRSGPLQWVFTVDHNCLACTFDWRRRISCKENRGRLFRGNVGAIEPRSARP